MVFGWGKKKEEETKTDTVESLRNISLSNVKNIVRDMKTSRNKILINEAKSTREKIIPQIEVIQNLTHNLEKDDLKVDEIDKHLKILVIRGKEQVISIIKKEASLKLPEVKTIDDAIKVEKEVNQLLKRVGDVLGRQSRVIHIFAKKYADGLKVALSNLNSDREQIHTLLKNHEQFDKKTSDILDELSYIDDLKNQTKENKIKIQSLRKQIEKNNNFIQNIKKDISNLKSSNQYNDYMEVKSKLSKLAEDEQLIEKEINLEFTKISRPLTKYQYVTSIDKHQKTLLEQLIYKPFHVLTPENKDDVIIILQSARKGVDSGSVSVKDQTKSLNQIDEITELVGSFIEKISNFNSKKLTLEKELKIFNIKKLEEKESDLSRDTRDNKDLESKIQNLEKELEESIKQIPKSIKKIESGLQNASSIRYTIIDGN